MELRALAIIAGLIALCAWELMRQWSESKQRALDLSTLRTGYGRSAFKAHSRFD